LYITTTLLFGFAAVNTGNNLIFLIVASLLAFMAVSGVLGWLNIKGLELRASVPEEVYSGLDTLVTVQMTNRKRRFPSFLITGHLLGNRICFDLLERGEEQQSSFIHRFPERGSLSLTAAEISSPFPINFFVRSRWLALNSTVTVFPAPVPGPMPAGCDGVEMQGTGARSVRGHDGDVANISDYTGAEPLKLIHWRLSAKHDSLKVKELTATSREPVMLELDSLPGKNLEDVLSSAAFLINRLIREHRPVGLKTKTGVTPPALTRRHRLQLLTELARYDTT
jgi:uncharacterized protein (DUF58 family)